MQEVNFGIIGSGTVGGGVLKAVQRNGPLMSSRLGVQLKLLKVAVKNKAKTRPVPVPASLMCTRWEEVVRDPRIHVVIEAVGGTKTAKAIVMKSLASGKVVVTANKALISAHGEEIFEAAQRYGVNFYYEAAVGGGIPIIKVLREGLVGNRINRIYGIVNGTCNYILTRMKLEGLEFDEVLKDAQRLGYAEAEPSLDVDGDDAMHKTGILASLAHGFWVNPKQIHMEGIRAISRMDIQFAERLGYTIKLLGIVKKLDKTSGPARRRKGFVPVQVSVFPTLVPNSHVLASVNHEFNAIFMRGDVVGDTLYYGRGAGQDATASAVLSDLADAALDLKTGNMNRIPPFVPHEGEGTVLDIDEVVSRYYVRLSVVDRPGTLGKIATILGRSKIGISSVIQPEGHEGESVPLILMIHDASHAAMNRALAQISRLPVIKAAPTMIRVETFD